MFIYNELEWDVETTNTDSSPESWVLSPESWVVGSCPLNAQLQSHRSMATLVSSYDKTTLGMSFKTKERLSSLHSTLSWQNSKVKIK